MLQAMMQQFMRLPGTPDYTNSYILAAQAVLAAHHSIQQRRVVLMDSVFPYELR